MSEISNNLSRLKRALVQLSKKELIAQALGIADPSTQSEEFWRIQAYTAQYRFFLLCRQRLGLNLAAQVDECSETEAGVISDHAEALLARGMCYETVRSWFLCRGKFEHNQAYELRHEQERLANTSLRVLLLLEPRGAKWLAFGPNPEDLYLVDNVEDAHHFPVSSIAQTSKPAMKEFAARFEYAKQRFGAKEVKVLCGVKPAQLST